MARKINFREFSETIDKHLKNKEVSNLRFEFKRLKYFKTFKKSIFLNPEGLNSYPVLS